MSPNARFWLTAMLLAACEASPESRGESFDSARTRGDAASDFPNDADEPGSDEPLADAAESEAASEAGDDAAVIASESDAGDAGLPNTHDGSVIATDDAGTASGETVFVSVGGEDNTPWLYTSCDGRSWTRRTLTLPPEHPSSGEGAGLRGIGYGGGRFVITGGGSTSSGNARLIGSSVDAVTWQWEQRPLACSDCQWMGGAAFLDDGKDGIWIAGGGNGARLYSRDGGNSWQSSTGQGLAPYRRFRSDGTRAVGTGQGVLTIVELSAPSASEPVVWRDSAHPIAHESVYVAAGNGVFVVVWYNGGCRFLRAGSNTFRACELPEDHDPVLTSVVFAEDKFSILGHGAPLDSTDGEHWTLRASGSGSDFRDVAYAESTYVTSQQFASDAVDWQDAEPSALHGTALATGKLGAGMACPR